MDNVVRSRVKPQLIRKRTIISIPNISIIVEPSRSKAKSLSDLAPKTIVKKPIPRQVSKAKPPSMVKDPSISKNISKPTRLKRAKIIYKTREPTHNSIDKINSLKNKGIGKALVIIGNGPSINQVDLSRLFGLKNVDTLSINKPDPRVWHTKYWAFYDTSQFRRHKNLWDQYSGYVFNSTAIKSNKDNTMQFKNLGGQGFSLEANKGIHIGRSSVYATMQISLWLNYDRIYIFGCDMNPEGIDGVLHFYGDNPDVPPSIRSDRFRNEAAHYEWAANNLSEDIRNRFVFCTEYNPWGFVNKFNQMSHKLAIDLIINAYEKDMGG